MVERKTGADFDSRLYFGAGAQGGSFGRLLARHPTKGPKSAGPRERASAVQSADEARWS